MAKPICSYRNFNEFWLEIVETYENNLCLVSGNNPDNKYTFERLNDYVDRTAYFLRGEGMKQGDRFIVLMENCIEFFFLYLASLKLGTLIVPVNPKLSENEIFAISDRFKPYLIFADADKLSFAKKCKDTRSYIRKSICINDKCGNNENECFPNILQSLSRVNISCEDVKLSDPGSLYCSSGTTGKPKGIPQSPLNLLTAAESLSRSYNFRSTDTQMGILPIYHTALVTYGFWPGIFAGSNFIIFNKFSKNRFWKDIENYKIAFVETVPTILSMLMNPPEDIKKYDLSHLKFIGSGSAPLSNNLWKSFEDTFGVRIANKYGLSETEPTHFNPPCPEIRKEGSIGKALDMCDVRIFDENDNEKRPGEVGELVMRGNNIINGYFQDTEETRKSFRNGWFYSGDLGYKDGDGFFFLVGRKKEIIIRGGINIYPPEVDNVLSSHPDVIEAVSFGLPDEIYGEEVYAAVVLKPESSVHEEEFISYSKERLALYKCPKNIFFAAHIPKTASGKPLRRELSKMYTGQKLIENKTI